MSNTALLSLVAEIFTSVSESAMVAIYLADSGEFSKLEFSASHVVDPAQAALPPDLLSPSAGEALEVLGGDVKFLSVESLERFDPSLKGFMQDTQFGAAVCIPLVLVESPEKSLVSLLGAILAFYSCRQGELTLPPKQVDRMKALATLTSLALSESRMVEKLARALEVIRRQQQLVSMAEIAAGMAHDASNILNTLSASYLVLEKEIDRSPTGRSYGRLQGALESVEQNLQKLATYFQRPRVYARFSAPSYETCDVNSILKEVLEVLSYRFEKLKIRVKYRFGDIPQIRGDKERLFQVFANIVLNALDAMKERGTLFLETKAGNYREVVVRISDDGVGIAEENRPHIFDAFFTTKNEGTGVGLTIAWQIIEAHGGQIEFTSKRGKGSTFLVLLPTSEGKAARGR